MLRLSQYSHYQLRYSAAVTLGTTLLAYVVMLIALAVFARLSVSEVQKSVIAAIEPPSVEAAQNGDAKLAGLLADGVARLPDVIQVSLENSDGEVLAAISKPEPVHPAWQVAIADAVLGDLAKFRRPLEQQREHSQVGALVFYFDVICASGMAFGLLEFFSLLTLCAPILGIGLNIYLYEKNVAHPLDALMKQVEAVDPEDPQSALLRIPERHKDSDYGRAVQKINAMLLCMGNVQGALRKLSTRDVSTNLPNRTLTVEYISGVARRVAQQDGVVGVFAIFLDRIEEFRELIGHEQVEEVVQLTASTLYEKAGDKEFVGRVADDVFVVVVEDMASTSQAMAYAERILQVLSHPADMGRERLLLPVSVGVSLSPDDGSDGVTILRKAVTAARNARLKSHDRWDFYEQAANDDARRRMVMEQDLKQAVQKRQFVLHYQPQFSADGKIVGLEALIRWQKPEGMVSPGDFIPVAEDSGLIIEIGDWVLEEACYTIARLQKLGFAIPIAVNVSPQQLASSGFFNAIKVLVNSIGISPRFLELEITEYAFAEGCDLSERVRELRDYGFRIAIDDFGTGYSSLSYLRRFPVDVLKIDRSFITDIPNDVAVPSTILTLARRLGMTCVAEGIENEEQAVWLRDHACSTLQGFLLARPMTFDAFLERYSLEDAVDINQRTMI